MRGRSSLPQTSFAPRPADEARSGKRLPAWDCRSIRRTRSTEGSRNPRGRVSWIPRRFRPLAVLPSRRWRRSISISTSARRQEAELKCPTSILMPERRETGPNCRTSISTPAGLDFDLGLGGDKPAGGTATAAPAQPAAASAAESALSIDFDLPMGDKPAEAPAAAPPAAPPAAPAVDLGAIDFDLGTPASGGEAKTETAKAQSLDLASIDLDLGAPGSGNGSGGGPDARWQEVATKLDLAKAYEEMGDKDGARELLKEVVKEGDAAQQQQAQTMLQALG